MSFDLIRDAFGLSVLVGVIAAVNLWSGLLGA
jgi:hypothetical protein